MPLYTFKRLSTNETWEDLVSLSRREEILKDKDVVQIIYAPAIISGVVGISIKTDDGFKEVLSKAAEAHPTSPLADRVLKRGNKEVKNRQVAKKHFGT
jgi:hypothetical protein